MGTTYPIHPQIQFWDQHLKDLTGHPIPTWAAGQQPSPMARRNYQLVWPRDKGKTNRPPSSWRRLKDVFTGKGPGIWITPQGSLGPHKPVWTNWHEYDNLGYANDMDEIGKPLGAKKYDFRTRKYKEPEAGDWSGVKWERRRHPVGHHYVRDWLGAEHTQLGPGGYRNPFRYKPHTPWMDWARPANDAYYYGVYMPNAAHI